MTETDLRIAVVSRELYPFGGGGMGNYVNWTARALADAASVTVVTSARHEAEYRRLLATRDPRLDPRVRHVFAPDFDYSDHRTFYGYFHRWSAHVHDALRRAYPDRGPDLIEFADYHGEGAVTVQARRAGDPWLADTCICVRLNSSAEMVLTLDGHLDDDLGVRGMFELERLSMRDADRIITPGGDVYGTYERFYADETLAPAVRIRHVVDLGEPPRPALPPAARDGAGDPTRLLFIGRLERRKGVRDLVDALLGLGRDDWQLTLVGGDTPTGPLGTSVRAGLELAVGRDERIEFVERVPRERVLELIDEHDVCVVPSRWECWPNVALEAFQRGRPVLGTPTGGLAEMVQPGRSGLLTEGTGPRALAAGLTRVLDGELRGLGVEGPQEVFHELTRRDEIVPEYVRLAEESAAAAKRRRVRAAPPPPLVSVVLTYFELDRFIGDAVASLLGQTHRPLEIVLVNDGSLRPEDEVVFELAERHPEVVVVTQPNAGLSAARNFGIFQARGELVMFFDGDDVAEPQLVERLVRALDADPRAAYATSWSRFADERGGDWPGEHGYHPLGNASRLNEEQNVAGSCVALIRREVFDRGLRFDPELASYEDWQLFRELAAAGRYGRVVPEALYRYRIRRRSMARTAGVPELRRNRGEMTARLRERSLEWTAP